MNKLLTKGLLTIALGLALSACSDDDDKVDVQQPDDVVEVPAVPANALVQTVAPDYSSSEVAAIDVENQQVTTGYYVKDASDYTVLTHGTDVYHLGRYNIDTVTKYSADALGAEVWSYSTQDNEDSTARNLYTLAFASDTKAYVIRYGSDKIWIVDPTAQSAEDFKTGEISLSAYVENNSLNTPRPSAAVVHDGKLFVSMQRLDDNWSTQTAYVAVFDTETDAEIETNANADDAVMGIPLTGLNPLESSLFVHEDTLYVTTNDSYSSVDKANSKIETINTETYELNTLVSAAELTDNAGASIHASVVVSPEQGYFVATKALFDPSYHEVSTVYQFNPTSGDITEATVAGTGTEDINHIALDASGFLWLSVAADSTPGLDIVDTATNELYIERLLTDLNPGVIAFLD